MLEFLASIDPTSLPLWAALLFSMSMYPLGFMLGAPCSPCCNQCQNNTCEGFDLEEAFSCRGGGTPYCFRSPDLLSLQFNSPCFGSGAAGTVSGPGGRPDDSRGPLTGVTLTNGGSGYAILGRRAPTITLANSATVPATVTVNLENQKDGCQIDTWRIGSVTITNGGRGYSDYQSVVFSVESGGVTTTAATGVIHTRNGEPTITATASPGTGATFTVTLTQAGASWRVASVAVSGQTSGYINGTPVVFSTSDGTVHTPATAVINTTGTNGEISSVTVTDGGYYYVIGVLDSIEFYNRGSYYYPDASLPAYVRPPTVTVVQTSPYNQGTGAVVTATVDVNTASPTFGAVTGLTLTNAGTNYLQWYKDDIEYLGEGKFAIGSPNHTNPVAVPKGCWAVGNNFAGKVIEAEWEFLYDYHFSDPIGCCQITYTIKQGWWPSSLPINSRTCGNQSFSYRTEHITFNATSSQCDNAFENLSNLEAECSGGSFATPATTIIDKTHSFTECKDCNGNNTYRRVVYDGTRGLYSDGTAGFGRWVVTVDADIDSVDGCVTFCGQSGLCGAPRRPGDNEFSGGPYGSLEIGLEHLRRMCVRWLCRCYEGLGRKNLRVAESLTATAPGGTGATFDVSVQCEVSPDDPCYITDVQLLSGGTGYPSSGSLVFQGAAAISSADVRFYTGRIAPTISATASGSGTGAELSVVLAGAGGSWGVNSVTIDIAGSGYTVGDSISFAIVDGEEAVPGEGIVASATVSAVNEEGGITEITVDSPGEYFKSNGIIESVLIFDSGAYVGDRVYPNPADWYTVKSTSAEIGGPPVFGGSLASKLEAATETESRGWEYNNFEHQNLFGENSINEYFEWSAEQGDVVCVVYAFTFFGESGAPPQIQCESPVRNQPRTVTSRDVYLITPCSRCSCQ